MGTPYKFEVTCCSAFCAYSDKQIADIIYNALNDFKDKDTKLTLESIEVRKGDLLLSSKTTNFKAKPPDFNTWVKEHINPLRINAGLPEMTAEEIESSKAILESFHKDCRRPLYNKGN